MTWNNIVANDPVEIEPVMQNLRHNRMGGDILTMDDNGNPLDSTYSAGNATYALLGVYSDNYYQNNSLLDFSQLISFSNILNSFAEASSSDGYPAYLSPGGVASLTTTLLAATTPFVFTGSGIQKTVSSNQTVVITAGFGSNNTLLINESSWTGGSSQETQAKVFGEKAHPSVIMNFDTAGSNISGLSVGDKVVFRAVNSSAAVEYIYCEMITVGASGTLRILWRAIAAGDVRITFRDNDTWTLCRTNWIFCSTTDGTLTATTVHPIEVDTLPSAGTANRYILLKSTGQWYLDNGSTVTATVKALIGASFSHNTADNGAVAYFPEWAHFKSVFLRMKKSDVQIQAANDPLSTSKGLLFNGTVQIADKIYKYKDARISTATAGDCTDSAADIAAVGIKYVYASYSTGKLYFSDIMPRKWDEGVLMHPSKMYRCIGVFFHSASAFYAFIHAAQTNLVQLNITDVIAANSLTTAYANYIMNSGYMPSYFRQIIQWYAGNGVQILSADSYISTGNIILDGASSSGSYHSCPVYSGYLRLKTSSDVSDNNYLAGYWLN